jgi:hypothetical protein
MIICRWGFRSLYFFEIVRRWLRSKHSRPILSFTSCYLLQQALSYSEWSILGGLRFQCPILRCNLHRHEERSVKHFGTSKDQVICMACLKNRLWTADRLEKKGWPNCLCVPYTNKLRSWLHTCSRNAGSLLDFGISSRCGSELPPLRSMIGQLLRPSDDGRPLSKPKSDGFPHLPCYLQNLERMKCKSFITSKLPWWSP